MSWMTPAGAPPRFGVSGEGADIGGLPEDVLDALAALFHPDEAEVEVADGVAERVVGLRGAHLDEERAARGGDGLTQFGQSRGEHVLALLDLDRDGLRG